LRAVAFHRAARFNLRVQPTGGDNFAEKLFTPVRFGILLALLIFAAFPQVLLGLQTFVARDFGFFAYPLAQFQRDCFWHGEIPFWNPYNNCGVPFLAQWNTMPLYPPALIYLTLPLTWSLSFFCLLHLWSAGLGMFFLARRWTGNNFAAAFAGVMFAFNGFTLNLLMWPSHMATFSWMPWVVLAAELAWRDGGRKIILAAIVGALQMLAGGPETIFLTWLIVAALWLQSFIKNDFSRGALLWRFPLIVILVIALSAAQLLPFLDLVAHAQRETGYTDLRWSMPGLGWANFLVPLAFGSTVTEGVFFQHGQYWTSSYYLGLAGLWLELLAIFVLRDRRVWLLGAIAIVGFMFALGENTPIYPALRKVLPQLSFITYPIKFISVAVVAAPLLAAFALANLGKIKKQILPLGAVLFALLVAILFWTQLAPQPGDDSRLALLNGFSRAGFLIWIGVILFFLAHRAGSKFSRVAPLALIVFAWLDVFTHAPPQNPTVPPWIFSPGLSREKLALQPQPALGGSRAMVSPAAANEFVNFAASDPKNNFLTKRLGYCADDNVLDAVPKVDGFFSLTPRESDAVLSLFYTTTNASYPRLEDFMGVSQITAPDQIFQWQSRSNYLPLVTAGQKPIFLDEPTTLKALAQDNFDGQQIVLLPTEAKTLVVVTNQSAAKILSANFKNQSVDVEVEAAAPALVVVAQTFFHDWIVTVDGTPTTLFRANMAFQAVQVPAGAHRLHFFYRDRAFQIGATVTVPAWCICLASLFFRQRRHSPSDP
jgi:hypothetical protein